MFRRKCINHIINECIPSNDFKNKYELFLENTNPEKFKEQLELQINDPNVNKCSMHYETLNKLLAITYLATGDEARAINHLTEAHAVIHRRQIEVRYVKSQLRHQVCFTESIYGLNPELLTFNVNSIDGPNSLRSKLKELPEEWHMVQLTIPYEGTKKGNKKTLTHQMHLTVMPTGNNNKVDPFCITLPKPNSEMYDICKEVKTLLDTNRVDLQTEYKSSSLYWQMRSRQNKSMRVAVTEMEKRWFREWRILLIADPLETSKTVQDIHKMIDKLINDDPSGIKLTAKEDWLLKKIATASFCLDKNEIARAVLHVLPKHQKLAKNIILSIHGRRNDDILRVENLKRKIVVLVIDEHLDYLPIEKMTVLRKQPVTRFSCVQLAYAMFKEHEDTIENGCKVMELTESGGTFIVNPSSNLPKMEERLKIFLNYWLPNWSGIYNQKPTESIFSKSLTNHNTLMYNGHGSGIQYFPGEEIERLRVTSTVLLFGCSSIKLLPVGGKFPPYGVCNQYLTACSPCILGMLWEVTDLDTDRLTVRFMSKWIPSAAPKPWSHIDLEQWGNDLVLKFKEKTGISESIEIQEPELLRAYAEAKEICTQYMTSAAAVVRGLPVKLKY